MTLPRAATVDLGAVLLIFSLGAREWGVRWRAAAGSAVLAVAAAACQGGGSTDRPTAVPTSLAPTTSPTTTTTIPLRVRLCGGGLGAPVSNARLEDPELVEVSGVVASRRHLGVLWVHNDSGDRARVFAIDRGGRRLGEFRLDGFRARDWEDIALLPGDGDAPDLLVIADIGDFEGNRPSIDLVLVAEPDLPEDPAVPIVLRGARRARFTYPDHPHEAETLLIDPGSGAAIVITKEYNGVPQIYVTGQLANVADTPEVLEHVAPLDLGLGQLPTAGDVSADGTAIVVRTYSDVFVFARHDGETVADALRRPPCNVPAPREAQGEAIALLPDGSAYVTIGEGAAARIWEVAIA
jgi:hypothetical protein